MQTFLPCSFCWLSALCLFAGRNPSSMLLHRLDVSDVFFLSSLLLFRSVFSDLSTGKHSADCVLFKYKCAWCESFFSAVFGKCQGYGFGSLSLLLISIKLKAKTKLEFAIHQHVGRNVHSTLSHYGWVVGLCILLLLLSTLSLHFNVHKLASTLTFVQIHTQHLCAHAVRMAALSHKSNKAMPLQTLKSIPSSEDQNQQKHYN